MNREAQERAIISRLTSQGCEYRDEPSTESSLYFFRPGLGRGFFIPRPQGDHGWTQAQMSHIHSIAEFYGLDFLPLDYNS